ncbi:MAG: hypothetical protein ACRC8Y_11455 [Chroococcales cyanobacterium]
MSLVICHWSFVIGHLSLVDGELFVVTTSVVTALRKPQPGHALFGGKASSPQTGA